MCEALDVQSRNELELFENEVLLCARCALERCYAVGPQECEGVLPATWELLAVGGAPPDCGWLGLFNSSLCVVCASELLDNV